MDLGKKEDVDIRKIWKDEAGDLTPWLALEENIQQLADQLGITIQNPRTEEWVGSFRLDILAEDSQGRTIIIENQLETSDHNHLGQILTYAAGQDANILIWLTKKFREEHRSVLDWLNNSTNAGISFFGVELKAIKIGDSKVAPIFDIVCQPNDWNKTLMAVKSESTLTESQTFYYQLWDNFNKYLEEKKSPLRTRKPQPQYWYDFALGSSKAWLGISASNNKNEIRAYFVTNIDSLFEFVEKMCKDVLTKRIGDEITVRGRNEGLKYKFIEINRHFDVGNKSQWDQMFSWFETNLRIFDSVIRPALNEFKE